MQYQLYSVNGADIFLNGGTIEFFGMWTLEPIIAPLPRVQLSAIVQLFEMMHWVIVQFFPIVMFVKRYDPLIFVCWPISHDIPMTEDSMCAKGPNKQFDPITSGSFNTVDLND